jgi:hypothetical protein
LALGGIARDLVHTTSLLDGTNRELRRKFRRPAVLAVDHYIHPKPFIAKLMSIRDPYL